MVVYTRDMAMAEERAGRDREWFRKRTKRTWWLTGQGRGQVAEECKEKEVSKVAPKFLPGAAMEMEGTTSCVIFKRWPHGHFGNEPSSPKQAAKKSHPDKSWPNCRFLGKRNGCCLRYQVLGWLVTQQKKTRTGKLSLRSFELSQQRHKVWS